MRYRYTFIVCMVCAAAFLMPSRSFPETKILLKNGSSIIADLCRETDSRLLCAVGDGTVEIKKEDIIDKQTITLSRQYYRRLDEPIVVPDEGPEELVFEPVDTGEVAETEGGTAEDAAGTEAAGEEPGTDSETEDEGFAEEEVPAEFEPEVEELAEQAPEGAEELLEEEEPGEDTGEELSSEEAEKRLAEITKQKLALKKDQEKLVTDREQLHKEIKEAGVVRSQKKLDSFTKRVDTLEERISKFNSNLDNLNKEEEELLRILDKE